MSNCKIVTVETALTVQAGAYGSADVMGGKLSIVLPRLGKGLVRGAIIDARLSDKAVAAGPYELVVFHTDPAASTFTENGAIAVADADLAKIAGTVYFPTAARTAFADNCINAGTKFAGTTLESPNVKFVLPEGVTTIYAVLVARHTPTPASTSDLSLLLTFALDAS